MAWLLVADDDPDLRVQLAEALAERGYEVRTAADGAEAVHLLDEAEEMPAAVILDMLMPRVSGREVLPAMRRIRRAREVPVIILSGITVDDKELAGFGVSAVFLKPVATQALFDAVEKAASLRG